MLRDAGFDIAGVFSSCADALEWFRGSSPDIVVMDIGLADGDCVRIATLLDGRNIPFVVHSANYANSGFHDPIFLQRDMGRKACLAFRVAQRNSCLSGNGKRRWRVVVG
ncbi:response regulator [Mesorhizobium sp. RSR565B]